MKLLTLNFLTCAIKTCKSQPSSFPLHPRDADLEVVETDISLPFLRNILPRLEWAALATIAEELGLPTLPATPPTREDLTSSSAEQIEHSAEEGQEDKEEVPSQTAKDLHRILLETCIKEGKLVCGNCGHEYKVMEGVANFLLPGHLV